MHNLILHIVFNYTLLTLFNKLLSLSRLKQTLYKRVSPLLQVCWPRATLKAIGTFTEACDHQVDEVFEAHFLAVEINLPRRVVK